MIFKLFLSLIFVPVVINEEATPAPPPPAAPTEANKVDYLFWNYLFPPGPPPTPEGQPSPTPSPTANPVDTAEQQGGVTDTMTRLAEDTGKYALDVTSSLLHSVAGMISPPGSQVDPNQDFLEQAASYYNLPKGENADPNTIFGLYDALSGLVEPTPDGGVTIKMPTSKMLEEIKPWTDSFIDTGPLITALKGYEAYQTEKNAVGDAKDEVQNAAGNVKDGITDAANKVGDFGGEDVDKVKDIFSG